MVFAVQMMPEAVILNILLTFIFEYLRSLCIVLEVHFFHIWDIARSQSPPRPPQYILSDKTKSADLKLDVLKHHQYQDVDVCFDADRIKAKLLLDLCSAFALEKSPFTDQLSADSGCQQQVPLDHFQVVLKMVCLLLM